MTETEKKALALMNEVQRDFGLDRLTKLDRNLTGNEALCRAIEQHEAFRQEVSDAVTGFDEYGTEAAWEKLHSLIIPKTDPLVEVIADYKRTKGTGEYATNKDMAAALRAALAARGLEVRKIGEGE